MDSYQTFMEIFKQAIRNRDYDILLNTLKNGQKFFAIVSTEHLESLVNDIFDRGNGLLYFLNLEVTQRVSCKRTDDVLKEGFQFLRFLIENFHMIQTFKYNIDDIKNVCQLTLYIECAQGIKKAAFHAFIKLIELFGNNDIDFDETLVQLLEKFPLCTIRDRRMIFCVLGKIIKHNGDVSPSLSHLDIIFRQLHKDSLDEYNSGLFRDFHMYFDAFSDMLDGIQPPDTIREKLFNNMYQWVRDLNLDRWKHNKSMIESGIEFFNRHMTCFADLLYSNYKNWHLFLQRFSRKRIIHGQRALKTFYRVIGEILTNRNNEESRNIFWYFLEQFRTEFENANLDINMLRLTVYGFSQMVAPCKVHLFQYDTRSMYSIIINCSLPLCSSERSDSAHIENICCYQEALSEILCCMPNITIEKINVLVKLNIYIIKRFPDLGISNNMFAISSLIKTICNLGSIDRSLLQRYLDNIFHDGIAWSCSHTLALDVELQRELNNLRQRPICYKNYLPLWTQLLNTDRYRGCEQLTQRIADILMKICVTLIGRLDIRVKQQHQDNAFSDVTFTQSAVNQADFRVFTNLVDLYVDVMNASDASLYRANTVHVFLREIIRLSYRYPLISGFYKLVRAALKIFDHTVKQEDEEKKGNESETKKLLSSYLRNTLELIPTVSNELLIACLYLILDAPAIEYIVTAVPSARAIPVFKIAFVLGLSDLELAYTALDALQMWMDHRDSRKQPEQTKELLCEIMPHLEAYLRSTESAVEISQHLTATTTTARRVKRVELIDTKHTLPNFQRQVLLFFGSLGCDVLSNFVHQRSLNTGASWNDKHLLKYTLSLPDARLTIYFDLMLPRIIALARDSSDRRTRIAACEVLHSMVALVIGLTARNMSNLENSFAAFYTTLCPVLFALGCDSDEVVRSLFQPLTLQLMHWLSSRFMLLSPVIPRVLDSLFDSLCDDANPSLREFAGMCLAEFTRWSIRQAPEKQETQSNVHQIVHRINHLALHPSTRKRVAAAVAFNHLYAILREDNDTVSTYWLEMFYCFVRSMDGCDDPSIAKALDHIEKVIRFKANLLNETVRDRRKPYEFDGTTLTHALYWLLSQCGSFNEYCRSRCMELFVNISQYVDGGSAQETMCTFVETYGIYRLKDIILRDLKLDAEYISTQDLRALLKALDYYTWLIERQWLPVDKLFPMQEHTISICISKFVRKFWQEIDERHVTTISREFEQLQTLRCKILMAILNFVRVLLYENVDETVNVLKWLRDESLFALIMKCIMHPLAVGFDVKNIEMTDKLPDVLETFLNQMKLRFDNNLTSIFEMCLLTSLQEYIPKLLNLHDIAQSDSCNELIQQVKGLIMLERCGMLDRSILEMSALANHVDAVQQIFNFLVNERIGELICADLSAQMIEYLQTLMEFQLLQHEESTTKILAKLISNDTQVIGTDSANIKHGEHFLNTFRDTIFKYMLTNIEAIMYFFYQFSHENPVFLLKLVEDILLHLKQHKRELLAHLDDTVDVILQQFKCLMEVSRNIDSRIERLINIYGTAIRLKSKPTEIKLTCNRLYSWILRQLNIDRDIEYKTKILQNFLVCLIDATDRAEDKPELLAILRRLKINRQSSYPQLPVGTNVNAMKMINCFETLLVLLSVTGSVLVLECAIYFAADADDRLFDEKLQEHLHRYYRGATLNSTERVLCSLEVTYQAFMNSADITNVKERLNVLRGFLLPAFEFCDVSTIERFFERNIRELHAISQQHVPDNNNDVTRHIIISKIGCYKLIAIMFARVELYKIVDVNGAIVRNAGLDSAETGRKLLRSLFGGAKNVRALKFNRPDCREFVRLLHCSAYNCTLAIVSLMEEEHFSAAFAENRLLGLLIWENIVDCNKRYRLGQIFDKHPKMREINVNIKSSSIVDDTRSHSYIHSYDLSASTLNEDINDYDFNRCVLLPSSAVANPESTMSVVLEIDDFNEHECMPYICGMLQHISNRRQEERVPAGSEQPKWLQLFISGMLTYNYPNIRLFMLKIVKNTDMVFKPYARFMLSPIARILTSYMEAHELNYLITDVLEILIDWPTENTDMREVQKLFEVFVDRTLIDAEIDTAVRKRVHNYHLDLIGRMTEKWRDHLVAPIILLSNKMTSAPIGAVYLILVMLRTNMAHEIIDRTDIISFLLRPLREWNESGDDTPLRCCECLGLYLKLLSQEDRETNDEAVERESKKRDIKEIIFGTLGSLKPYNCVLKQVKRIGVICRACPELSIDYITIVISIAAAHKNLGKSQCLEIFELSMSYLGSSEHIVNCLRRINLNNVLTNQVSSCDKIALRIVHKAVAMINSPNDLLPYVNLTIPYVKNNLSEYRELVYNMLMSVYKKYSANASEDVDVKTLLSVCERNLVIALLDPSQELQTRVLRFWTEETNLSTDRSKERLIAALNMHSRCSTEDAHALLVPLLMLQLASRSFDYTEKIFEPLHNGTYEDYRIAVSWRRRNLSCVTPMFVDSLASQINCTFSQSVDHDGRNYDPTVSSYYHRLSRGALRLRATQDLQFDPTVADEEGAADADLTTISDNSTFAAELDRGATHSRWPQNALQDKRFPRFLANPEDVADIARQWHIENNAQRAEMIKQENIRQRSSVRLYRNYRIGDFPDIHIPHSSLIEPLQQLIKLDRLICKSVTVLLIVSLIKDLVKGKETGDFRLSVIESLKRILRESDKENSFHAVVLETLLMLDVSDCDPQDIVRVSKVNGLNTLGALLVEKCLQPDVCSNDDEPTSSKRKKRDESDEGCTDKWAQLASLYKSLNDVDVVLSIFREQSFSKDVQKAAVAEVNSNWARAGLAFERACERTNTVSSIMSEHCLQGLLEAKNNLCDWSAIDNLVKRRTKGDLNRVWSDEWRDWIIPYVFDANVQMLADDRDKSLGTVNNNLQVILSWKTDPDKLKHIKLLAGEDLVIFLLKKEKKESAEVIETLNNLLDRAGEQWVRLNPLCTELGMRKLQKLQEISDIYASLNVYRYINEKGYLERMSTLLDFWSRKAPAMRDSLRHWNKLAACRTYFSSLFEDAFNNMLDDHEEHHRGGEIRSQMQRVDYQLRLSIIDAALKQKHQYIARMHMDTLCLKNDCSLADLQPRLKLHEARIACLRAEFETNTRFKTYDYINSWKNSHLLLKKSSNFDDDTIISVKEHIASLASTIERLIRKNQEFADALFTSDVSSREILQDIGATGQSSDLECVAERLLSYSLDNLNSCCDLAATAINCNVGEHYYILTREYYGWLTSGVARTETETDEIFQSFMLAVLKAMYHDHYDATHYFPCLLSTKLLRNDIAKQIFMQECKNLRPWLFLRWRDLLFSHLGKPMTHVIMDILERLVKAYPDATIYTYLLTVERNPDIMRDTQRIRALLSDKMREIEHFRTAMRYVVQPELYLKHYLNQAMEELSEGKATALETLLREVYPPISGTSTTAERSPRPGNIYRVIAVYESEIRALNPVDRDATRESVRRIKERLDRSLVNRANGRRLKDYSPFLHEYAGGCIEIPGQYNGDREPTPREYRASIARIEPVVEVMRSLRKPIRISMIGDNGREYKFLVKFGEDLTVDHGLQQLYTTMNRTLRNDACCRQRQLAIETYEVIPLSRSYGLIQWIEDTRSLEDLVRFTLSKKESDQYESIRKEYAMWIARAAPSSERIADQYKQATSKYSQTQVIAKMKCLISETNKSSLRNAFTVISSSPESFVTLRRNFVTSYATMCIAHWISGVGDRHLQNTLVIVGSGRCLGIDFGHAFDAGLRVPVPELAPFRLTPQILQLLQPFTEKALLGTIMTHTMRALRDDKNPILACMDIFIHKPVNRPSGVDDETARSDGENVDADSTWSSKRNIEIVAKKLDGIHPSYITLEQLKEAHNDVYLKRYHAIVTGNDGLRQARAAVRNDCLTPAEQVDCLLNQATDLNILGRMYANWQPWL